MIGTRKRDVNSCSGLRLHWRRSGKRAGAMALVIAVMPLLGRADGPLDRPGQGFVSLFNGKDFEGWNAPVDERLFKVQNGEIVAHWSNERDAKSCYLFSNKEFSNFIFRIRVKPNLGRALVYFRGHWGEDKKEIVGNFYNLAIEVDDIPERKGKLSVPEGGWHEFTFTLNGNHLTVVRDGVVHIDGPYLHGSPRGAIALRLYDWPAETRLKDLEIKIID
jgi:Domain of Unknown Function (DUF1080)